MASADQRDTNRIKEKLSPFKNINHWVFPLYVPSFLEYWLEVHTEKGPAGGWRCEMEEDSESPCAEKPNIGQENAFCFIP